MAKPLMPMATAVWLVDNTTITFRQIARFTGLHPLEVQGIADETVGMHIVGLDPILNGQITQAELERCQDDKLADLILLEDEVPAAPRTKGPRYTPVSKRQDKPDAIAWLLRNHPELSDAQVGRLVGTTKPTITAIRDRSHWNISNITPNDPVGLGLCTQIELDETVSKAAERVAKKKKQEERAARKAAKEAGIEYVPPVEETPPETASETDAEKEAKREAYIFSRPSSSDTDAPDAAPAAEPASGEEAAPKEEEKEHTADSVFGS